jgi:cysteinyl-tRNA synthetase
LTAFFNIATLSATNLQDYFGYNIFYVMNVTDVDDKICLKARQNFLLQEYKSATFDPKQVSSGLPTLFVNAN